MITRAKYRGMYPTRISTVWSVGRSIHVRLNNKHHYTVHPLTKEGQSVMPRVGMDILYYQSSPHHRVERVI